jgi:hypothetical protein
MSNSTAKGTQHPPSGESVRDTDHITIPIIFLLLLAFVCCIHPNCRLGRCFQRHCNRTNNSNNRADEGRNEDLDLQSLNEGMWMKVREK